MRLTNLIFRIFDMVNLIIRELSQIKKIAAPDVRIIVQGTTVPNLKIREWPVFSTKESKGQKSYSRFKFQFNM